MKRQSNKIIRNGEPETWIGVNFWSRAGGPRMWRDYDPELVTEELTTMRDHGITVTRSFFYWPDFMPTPDTLDEVLVERYRDFLDIHEKLGMTTIPSFIVGHMSGENWDPVWRDGRDLYSDVWFVGRQAWYVRELTARFSAHPAVRAWLLTNEVPIYGDELTGGFGTNDPKEVHAWAQILTDAVRLGGGTQPLSIGDGVWGVEVSGKDNGFRVRELVDLIDFHGPHVYRMENDPVRQNLVSAFLCELLDIGGKPVIVEEFGLTSDYVSEANAASYYRQVLHNTLLAGATGWLAWNNTDYDDLFDVDPYDHHPFEMHFGITDGAGVPKLQAAEMQRFSAQARAIGFERLSRPDAEAAIVVSSFLEKRQPFTQPEDATTVFDVTRQAYIAAKEADIPVGLAREVDGLPEDCKLYLVPSSKQILATTWRKLRDLAAEGATVYASYFVAGHGPQRGLWWPDTDEMFGVRKKTRYGIVDPVADETTVRFVRPFGGITEGEEFTVVAAGAEGSRSFLPVDAVDAEVLAVDQLGNPVLLRRRTGKGWMVLGTLPFEFFASARAFSNPEPTWRLYDALAAEAGVRRVVRVHDPRVLVSEMVHESGRRYVWLVSQSPDEVTVVPTMDVADAMLLDSSGHPVTEVTLAPYGVEILSVEE